MLIVKQKFNWRKLSVGVLLLFVCLLLPISAQAATNKKTGHTGSASDPVVTGSKSLKRYLYSKYWTGNKVTSRKNLLNDYPATVGGNVKTYYVRVGTSKSTPISQEDQLEDSNLYVFWCSALDRAPGSDGASESYESNPGSIYSAGGKGTFYNTFGYGIQPKFLTNDKEQRNETLYHSKKLSLWIANSGFNGPYNKYNEAKTASQMLSLAKKGHDVGSFWFATSSGDRAKHGACTVYYAKYSTLYKKLSSNQKVFSLHAPDSKHKYHYYTLYLNGMPSIRKNNKWGRTLKTQNEINLSFQKTFYSDKKYVAQNINHKVEFEVATGLSIKVRIWDSYKGKVATVYKKGDQKTKYKGEVNLTSDYGISWDSKKVDHTSNIQDALLAALAEYGCVTDASDNKDPYKVMKYKTVKNYKGDYNQASLFFLIGDYNAPKGQQDQYDAIVPIGIRVYAGDADAYGGKNPASVAEKSSVLLDDKDYQNAASKKGYGWLSFDPRQASTDREGNVFTTSQKQTILQTSLDDNYVMWRSTNAELLSIVGNTYDDTKDLSSVFTKSMPGNRDTSDSDELKVSAETDGKVATVKGSALKVFTAIKADKSDAIVLEDENKQDFEKTTTDFMTGTFIGKKSASDAKLKKIGKNIGKAKAAPNYNTMCWEEDGIKDKFLSTSKSHANKAAKNGTVVYIDIICDRVNHYEKQSSFYALDILNNSDLSDSESDNPWSTAPDFTTTLQSQKRWEIKDSDEIGYGTRMVLTQQYSHQIQNLLQVKRRA